MNKKVLDFIEKCEGWKTAIKTLHWDADNMSQHELCDSIAERLAEFQDQVSEVEQSITGKLKPSDFKPTKYTVKSLKSFVEDVLDVTNTFYKAIKDEGDTYVGMASDCESFLSDMQRNLYLVNFTLKEELKNRLRDKINESMPKNLGRHDEVDKFMGRKPKSIQARINQIYRIVKKYGIDSRVYSDEAWQAISDYYRAISSLGCEVEMKPCANLNNSDSLESDGGYCDYDEYDHMPRSKQYSVKITFEDGMSINGYIKCMAAGTVQNPFSRYDTCIVLWPKNNRVLEGEENMNKKMSLSEAELKQLVKEATIKVLTETPLDYDVDNFSGRWNKNVDDSDYIDGESEGYFDDPNRKRDIELDLDDYASEEGDTRPMKDIENDYSWGLHDNQPIAQGVESEYYKTTKAGVPHEVDYALRMRNRENNWSDRELRHGGRMMDKYVNGQRDADDIGDAWDDLHYESKKPMKVTESELKDIVREAAINLIKEYGNTLNGAYKVGKLAARQSFRDNDKHKGARTLFQAHSENGDNRKAEQLFKTQKKGYDDGKKEFQTESEIKIKPSKKGTFTAAATKHGKGVQEFASQVLNNKENYSPSMVKKANFAKNFGGKK